MSNTIAPQGINYHPFIVYRLSFIVLPPFLSSGQYLTSFYLFFWKDVLLEAAMYRLAAHENPSLAEKLVASNKK